MTDTEAHAEPIHPQLELEQSSEDYSKFLLYSRTEILFALRTLIQKGTLVTVYFDHGNAFLLTSLLALNSDSTQFICDLGSDPETNRKALQAYKLVFATTIDQIKIQFSIDRLSRTTMKGRAVFCGPIPETLLRLQRRDFFRLSTPIAQPISCTLPMVRADGTPFVAEARVVDISGSGVGLVAPQDQTDLYVTEAVFNDCRFELPSEGLLRTDLRVRSAFNIATKGGAHYLRIGGNFISLNGAQLAMIQRYITRMEQQRRARLSGSI